jgi:putative ubiquitin-RnfH superfamily antitoxin RatB of RatAB toxin-antitoxin module
MAEVDPRSTAGGASINVEVAYARPDRQEILSLSVRVGTTAIEAVHQSGIVEIFPEIEPGRNRLGVFGKLVQDDTELRDGDRVEIYRPLKADPKEVRRQRAREGRTMRKGS